MSQNEEKPIYWNTMSNGNNHPGSITFINGTIPRHVEYSQLNPNAGHIENVPDINNLHNKCSHEIDAMIRIPTTYRTNCKKCRVPLEVTETEDGYNIRVLKIKMVG